MGRTTVNGQGVSETWGRPEDVSPRPQIALFFEGTSLKQGDACPSSGGRPYIPRTAGDGWDVPNASRGWPDVPHSKALKKY